MKAPANQFLVNFLPSGIGWHLVVIVAQVFLIITIYSQTASFDFVYYDDTEYVTANAMVRNGLHWEGIKWAFTTFYFSNWHPLTWISHMADVSFAGVSPGIAHLHNVALHFINSLLVYVLFLRLGKRWVPAAIFSSLFLVHPLHVESVAWIAERKDVLCALFFLSGVLLYDWYREKPSLPRYLLVILAHGLALLSKPMAVTFPVVLLALDLFYYDHSKFTLKAPSIARHLICSVIHKLPLLLLSLALGIATILAQHEGGAIVELDVIPLSNRFLGAVTAYGIYLKQFVIPIGLSAFYPASSSSPLITSVIISAILLSAIALLCCALFRKKPLFLVGYCWFLVMLLPVVGILQVGGQAHADRYMYLPSVGLLLTAATIFPASTHTMFRVSSLVGVLITMVFSVLCFWQVSSWENRNTLFQQVIRVSGENYAAHIALAQDYIVRRNWIEAEKHALASVKMKPNQPFGYRAVADIALARGEFKKAEEVYRIAATHGKPSVDILNNLGISLAEQGNYSHALDVFREALSVDPNHYNTVKNIEYYQSRLEDSSR